MTTIRHGGPPASAMRRGDGVAPATAPAGCRACRVEALAWRTPGSARRPRALDRVNGSTRPSPAAPVRARRRRRRRRLRDRTAASAPPSTAPTVSASPSAFSCSVGVSSSFSTISRVISSTRARASGGSDDSLNSSRSSSERRIASNRCRSATTVGIAPRERSQAPNFSTSSPTIASARATLAGPPRQVLAHGRLQVVDVVEEHLLDLAGRRLDVARHGDVDDEQRPVAPRPHHRLDVRLGEDRRRRAGRGDDDVARRRARRRARPTAPPRRRRSLRPSAPRAPSCG